MTLALSLPSDPETLQGTLTAPPWFQPVLSPLPSLPYSSGICFVVFNSLSQHSVPHILSGSVSLGLETLRQPSRCHECLKSSNSNGSHWISSPPPGCWHSENASSLHCKLVIPELMGFELTLYVSFLLSLNEFLMFLLLFLPLSFLNVSLYPFLFWNQFQSSCFQHFPSSSIPNTTHLHPLLFVLPVVIEAICLEFLKNLLPTSLTLYNPRETLSLDSNPCQSHHHHTSDYHNVFFLYFLPFLGMQTHSDFSYPIKQKTKTFCIALCAPQAKFPSPSSFLMTHLHGNLHPQLMPSDLIHHWW